MGVVVGEVAPAVRDGRFSISRLATEFGMDRRTVTTRLANVTAAGTRDGHPVYNLRDAAAALLGHSAAAGDPNDPTTLPPEKRRAWYQSEHIRTQLEVAQRKLIPAAEVEAEMAEQIKRVVQFLETLPDILERDAGLTPEQVTSTQKTIDKLRQGMYEAQVADELRHSA